MKRFPIYVNVFVINLSGCSRERFPLPVLRPGRCQVGYLAYMHTLTLFNSDATTQNPTCNNVPMFVFITLEKSLGRKFPNPAIGVFQPRTRIIRGGVVNSVTTVHHGLITRSVNMGERVVFSQEADLRCIFNDLSDSE